MAAAGGSPENSFYLGSEDVNYLKCQPCELDDKTVEAVGMCVTCQEYLCQPCFDVHKLPTPCKNHELLKKENILNNNISIASKDKCTELCKYHTDKVIEYHCVNHDVFGCSACMIEGHRTCEVAYIPKVALDLDSNNLYKQVETLLIKMEQKSQNIDTLSIQKSTKLDTDSSDAIEKIQNFRRVIINQKLDMIEAQLKQKTVSIKDENMTKIIKLTDQCDWAQAEVEEIIKKMKSLKSRQHKCSLYMYMVIIRGQLQPLYSQLDNVERNLTIADCHINFNPNFETLELLNKQDTFGSVSLERSQEKLETVIW